MVHMSSTHWRSFNFVVLLLAASASAFQWKNLGSNGLGLNRSLHRREFHAILTKPAPLRMSVAPDGDSDNDFFDGVDSSKKDVAQLAGLFWQMASPYYQGSKSGRLLFWGVIGLTLLNSGVSVVFSYLGKDFWNALSSKDTDAFYNVLQQYVPALLLGAPISTYYRFQREQLAVSWREWMTDRTLQMYYSRRVYYAIERGKEIDNPDQRIAEDVKAFTAYSLQLFITIITSIIDLVSFSLILYSIYPQLFGAIVAYAAFGTLTTTWLGRTLVSLNFKQLQKEADFRYSLVRMRENSESIAFYSGEDLEGKAINQRFNRVIGNSRKLNVANRNLEYFTVGYRYIIQILPVSVVAPKYFAGELQLGQVSQSASAFNHILSDLSIIINQFERLSQFTAGIDRLAQFFEAVRSSDPERNEITPLFEVDPTNYTQAETNGASDTVTSAATEEEYGTIDLQKMSLNGDVPVDFANHVLSVSNLDLCTPDQRRLLIRNLSFQLRKGTHLLIVGSSGAGKSSFLRAIAGLWTTGNGSIARPDDEDVYFLPQRPYCSIGSLKDQLLYPSIDESDGLGNYPEGHVLSRSHLLKQSLTDEDLLEVLEKVDLGELAARAGDGDPYKGLQVTLDWSNILSLGEQQRLGFGRVLVNQPKLVIMDEATSALDMVAEARMYTLLQNMARNTFSKGQWSGKELTYVSVGHRPSLLAFHDQRLRLAGEEGYSLEEIEKGAGKISLTDIANL